jgi:hypothetical protein
MALMSRRGFLGCLAGCGAGPLVGSSVGEAAVDLAKVAGCCLIGTDVNLVRNRVVQPTGSTGNGTSFDGKAIVGRTTNNPQLDLALDTSMKRLADAFGVFPGFAFFDDSDGRNAFATPDLLFPGRTGTVVFGINLFKSLMAYDPTGVSVLGVMAHEFGHILQFNSNEYEVIRGNQPTVKRIELHADFMCGYYLGVRKLAEPAASLWDWGQELSRLGDTNFNSPFHHGTPAERVASAEEGFNLGYLRKANLQVAFTSGMNYVSNR